MKSPNLLRIVETAALTVAVAGASFKLLHWPGANVLLIAGLSAMACFQLYKAWITRKATTHHWPIQSVKQVALAALITGALFYLLHWPGGAGLLKATIAVLAAVLLWEMMAPKE